MEPIDELRIMVAKFVLVEKPFFSEQEISFFFTLKQRWFPMDQSKALVQRAKDLNIIVEEGEDEMMAGFDINGIEMPAVFNPSKNLLSRLENAEPAQEAARHASSDEPENLLMQIVQRIKVETGDDTKTVMREVNRKQKETGFVIEVAALIVARKHGADARDLLDQVEKVLMSPGAQ